MKILQSIAKLYCLPAMLLASPVMAGEQAIKTGDANLDQSFQMMLGDSATGSASSTAKLAYERRSGKSGKSVQQPLAYVEGSHSGDQNLDFSFKLMMTDAMATHSKLHLVSK